MSHKGSGGGLQALKRLKSERRRRRAQKWKEERLAKSRASELVCKSKIRHLSRKSALTEIQIMRHKGIDTAYAEVYPCDVCNGYHITLGRKRAEEQAP